MWQTLLTPCWDPLSRGGCPSPGHQGRWGLRAPGCSLLGELPGPERTHLTQRCLMKSSPLPPGGPTANARWLPQCKNPSSSQTGTTLVLLWLQNSLRDQAELSQHLNHIFPQLSPSPHPASCTSLQASPESTPLANQNRSQTRSEEKVM